MLRSTIGAAALSLALLVSPYARAENDGGAAAAESLFQEGRKLMEAKRYSEACPKFAASQKIAPAIGTLLNLADCYEKNNQLASAWARFHEAIALAQRLGRTNREQTARERAERLEPRLIKLTIFARASGLDVKLDGNAIDPAVLGTPIPVDAGKHTIEATAKNKKPFVKDFEVSEKAKSPSVEIPPLEDDPEALAKDKEKEDDKKVVEPPKETRGWSTQKTIGLIVGGVGVVGLGVGGYFGLKTSSTWREAQSHCTSNLECDPDGVTLAGQAKSSGNIATIASIAGGALVVGGAILFFTAPSQPKTGATRAQSMGHPRPGRGHDVAPAPIRVGVGPGSMIVKGEF